MSTEGSPTETDRASTSNETEKVPPTLQEFREVPKDFVSVFIVVSKRRLDQIAREGLKAEDIGSRMAFRNPKLEQIFKEAATAAGSAVDRTQCVFAYPKPPETIKFGMSFNPAEQVVLEAKIDPSNAVVANGEVYTEASWALSRGDEDGAKSWAELYWREAKPLTEYREEIHRSGEDDHHDFTFPEVLIPKDIQTDRLKLKTS